VLKTIDKIEPYLRPLLNFARDEIRAYEALGRLAPGQLRPEGIVDEALLDAMQNPDQPPRGQMYPWLRDMVRRAVERAFKQYARQRSLFAPVGEPGSIAPRRLIDVLPNPSSPIPEHVVESLEFQHALATILRQLPTIWREPFLLHVRDGLSAREVAEIEGLPVAEARQRIERAREFLRARLAEEYTDTPLPPPTETIFELLDRIEPTPEQLARTRARLDTAA
jgi:RNA polymerase sigma factor (sigma-70 family)